MLQRGTVVEQKECLCQGENHRWQGTEKCQHYLLWQHSDLQSPSLTVPQVDHLAGVFLLNYAMFKSPTLVPCHVLYLLLLKT